VARVHGPAIGGGLELALACDAIVASPKAAFAFPETGIGIYPGLGGTQRTPRRIGPGLAKALIFTGRTLGAEDALAIGLVDAVVPHEEIDARVRELAARGVPSRTRPTPPAAWDALERFFGGHDASSIAAGRADTGGDERLRKAAQQVATKAPLALRAAEELIDAGSGRPLVDGLRLELARLREIFGSADALEGLSSLGRRRPEFQGR
jgi:enoyl-CoA hydratase/3-hydroxyacyl-CoA dehydrogenase